MSTMFTATNGLESALERVRGALRSMRNGEPDAYIACWAESDDATLFGAWGPIEQGYKSLADTFRWVGSRFKGGDLSVENTVVYASGDLAYTVGFERGDVIVDTDGTRRPMVIRVTHIYRRFGDDWKLVHRHADFPPEDQRQSRR
jgi:ketosteroid isomerase-like protein